MKTLKLIQGTPEWHQHRATHFNASDAPAMLGISPYKTRAELLREYATGVRPEVDAATQRRFDEGHRFEALARPLAEEIVGEDLYPCVGVPDDAAVKLSASFDGLTMLGDVAFEHKASNDALRDISSGHEIDMDQLPEHYAAQMEQQCMVSGCDRVLFMASKWDENGVVQEYHGWYYPDAALRARIIAGWAQFERDLGAYKPEPAAAPAPVGRAPETLPTLRVEVEGHVLATNLDQFRTNAMQVLGSINRDLKTDDDFADAESTVKWCKGVEDRLDSAKANVLAQMQSVDEVCRTIDAVSAETRKVRLELDRLVKSEKERRRAEIVAQYQAQLREHYQSINATLGEHALGVPMEALASIGAAIKGRKTLGSITDAADAACASAKIAASQSAERIRKNIAVLAEFPEHAHLFADRVQLCARFDPDDVRRFAKARIAEHQQREAARLEAERERIRHEEAARIEREQQPAARATQQQNTQRGGIDPEPVAVSRAGEPQGLPTPGSLAALENREEVIAKRRASTARIKLGDINARIAPLSITASGLAQIGFQPVGHEGAAKLYAANDFGLMQQAMLAAICGNADKLRETA